ncbi:MULTISPECIES: LacI family DNA-binding transcriptional regulator [Paenibacillus]|uniref:LacI family DNA-binding transcriptional regulator n=1 Tax=Paenibacillus TaxID=44249 RepID=UPI0022B9318E|nr:LacI family DNA-binding transcriptional regulator [Paenibacillus caseinilyticus]MCZ8521812.1 LacI family DNA-binding transcriptional regulator [Paenibacillus caseinilyticus]
MDKKIVDVAKHAGVSPATVSRVLNESSHVSDTTRRRVLEAVRELGYHPNASAKNLRSQKTMTIGVSVGDINTSYFAAIIKGVQQAAAERRYKVLICDIENRKEKESEYLDLLRNRTVDGMVLVQPMTPLQELEALADNGYELAVVGRYVEHPGIPCAYTDNVEFSRRVVTHLIEGGHRSVAFISGAPEAVDSYERLEGYLKALREQGIPFRPGMVEHGGWNEHGGYEAVNRLLDGSVGFSALYTANDEMALGVYRACRERGLRIPQDLAVVGVDDNRVSRYLSPALSTVSQPNFELGASAARRLLSQMNGEREGDPRSIQLPSELVVRESSHRA